MKRKLNRFYSFFSHWIWSFVITIQLTYIGVFGGVYLSEVFQAIKFNNINESIIKNKGENQAGDIVFRTGLYCENQMVNYIKNETGEEKYFLYDNDVGIWKDTPVSSVKESCVGKIAHLIYSDEISLSFYAKIYLGVILLFVIFFLSKEYANSMVIKLRERELNKSIQTTPPYEVTREFQKIIRIMGQNDSKIRKVRETLLKGKVPEEQIDEQIDDLKVKYIRTCLNSIAKIAKYFHNSSDGDRFASNVMVLQSTQDLIQDASMTANITRFSQYNNLNDVINNEPRFLKLSHELSSSTDTDNRESKDDLIQKDNVLLPIPNNRKGILPGAASAYVSKNLNDIILDCQDAFKGNAYPGISNKVKQAQDDYFNSGQGMFIRSFLAIRITDESNNKPIGVLNIHSGLKEMFINLDKRIMFIQLISPIIYKIHYLIEAD